MKTIITKKHEYLSGWTLYEMVWKTDYADLGKKNMTLQSVAVVSKEPFSSKILNDWAAEQGYDLDALFTVIENSKEDVEKMNRFGKIFEEKYCKNLEALNSDNKCHVQYSATINPNYRPLMTAFEVFKAYDVKVRIEYKSGALEMVFLSQGRQKNSGCTMIVFSGSKLKAVYEEDEAIEKIKCRIDRYVNDCDTDEKFQALPGILKKIQDDLKKFK